MFFPNSPRPPRGMILQTPKACSLGGGRAQDAGPLETAPDLLELRVAGLDHRQPEPADVVAEEFEGRLDRDRVRRHLEQLERGSHLLVQRSGTVDVARLVPA